MKVSKTDWIHNITNKTIPRIKRHAFQFPVFLLLAGFLCMSTVPSFVYSSSAKAIFQALFCLLFKTGESPTKSSYIRAKIRVNHDNLKVKTLAGSLGHIQTLSGVVEKRMNSILDSQKCIFHPALDQLVPTLQTICLSFQIPFMTSVVQAAST